MRLSDRSTASFESNFTDESQCLLSGDSACRGNNGRVASSCRTFNLRRYSYYALPLRQVMPEGAIEKRRNAAVLGLAEHRQAFNRKGRQEQPRRTRRKLAATRLRVFGLPLALPQHSRRTSQKILLRACQDEVRKTLPLGRKAAPVEAFALHSSIREEGVGYRCTAGGRRR